MLLLISVLASLLSLVPCRTQRLEKCWLWPMGKVVGTLYILDHIVAPTVRLTSVALNVHSTTPICTKHPHMNKDAKFVSLWHKRLNHASAKPLKHISFLSEIAFSDFTKCDVCPLAKQSRLPFYPHVTHTNSVFELIHVDLWGPYQHECQSGTRFMVTIDDDHSRLTWTFLISLKSQTLSILTKFIKMVVVHFHKNIQTLRSDNGIEFFNTAFQSLLAHPGILHQRSCVYTHPSTKRCCRKQTQTTTTNCLPSSILDRKTPYEILYNKP